MKPDRDRLAALRERMTVAQRAAYEQRLRGASAGSTPARIPRRDPARAIPLSHAQRRLWVLDQLEPGTATYNIAASVAIEGPLDPATLEAAIAALVDRHEALRTRFAANAGGEPVQVVEPAAAIAFRLVDATALDGAARAALLAAEARIPFDLARLPLLRTTVLRLAEDRFQICLVVHHIVWDGWSTAVFLEELAAAYTALRRGEPPALAPLPIQFPDFAVWQHDHLTGETLDRQLAFWRSALAGAPARIELPRRAAGPGLEGGRRARFVVPADTARAAHALARREGATLFMVIAAAVQAVLHRYSGQHDIVLGVPVANRGSEELERLIGFFANTIALRLTVDGSPAFHELIGAVRRATLDAQANQDAPLDRVVHDARAAAGSGAGGVFNTVLALQGATRPMLADGLRIGDIEAVDTGTRAFDLAILLSEAGDGIRGAVEYDVAVLDDAMAERLARDLVRVLDAAVRDPTIRPADVELLPADERAALCWGPRSPTDRSGTIHGRVAAHARAHPDDTAVVCDGRSLTHGELDHRAAGLAARLAALGVGREAPVALYLERSLDLPVAVLGVLRAGGVAVPLEPSYPADRIAYMLDASRPRVVIAQRHLAGRLPRHAGDLLVLDDPAPEPAPPSVPAALDPDQLAFVFFTSGSTGQPKGVEVMHRGITNHLDWMRSAFELGRDDRGLQKGALSFLPTIYELFAVLTAGGRIVMASPDRGQDAAYLCAAIAEHGITTIEIVPTLLEVLLRSERIAACRSLRHVFVGGEALPRDTCERFHAALPRTRLHNLYGQTEVSAAATHWESRPRSPGPIAPVGRPTADTSVYVLDARLRACPRGAIGEIVVGGDGVGRGYAGAPEPTARAFLPDPFSPRPGGRMYRSGDLGRWLDDGSLEYLGRADQQVKLRGIRIELAEIEAALRDQPGVGDAVVDVRSLDGTAGGATLVGYVVPAALGCDPGALRPALRARLPEHMVPSHVVVLERLPLTPSGKIDRKALPLPERALAAASVAPGSPTEQAVAAIWAEVLGVERVGALDEFFDIGGQSLRAAEIVSRIRARLHVDLPLRAMFEATTVRGLARRIDDAPRGPEPLPLVRVGRDAPLPLSFAQESAWLHEPDEGGRTNVVSLASRIAGPLDVEALRCSLEAVVARHEALRTRIELEDGAPRQRPIAASRVALPVVDLEPLGDDDRAAAVAAARGALLARFDLASGLLVRASLLRWRTGEHHLLLAVHRMVFDGSTLGLLVHELAVLYPALRAGRPAALPALEVQIADVAVWERARLTGRMTELLAAWHKRLSGAPLVRLATDRPRPAAPTFRGDGCVRRLEPGPARRLDDLARARRTTLFGVLCAGFSALLHQETGATDLCIAVPMAKRLHPLTEPLLARFANQVALRVRPAADRPFDHLVAEVESAYLDAVALAEAPHHLVDAHVFGDARPGESPLHAFAFNYLNQLDQPLDELRIDDLVIQPLAVRAITCRHDVLVNVEGSRDGLAIDILYRDELFDRATIERLADRYIQLLTEASAHPGDAISALAGR
ncbi:MAG TPA: amino acid adenylation domain-containing protein [Kofleriaceae bacterium]|jgi:amino acid adenylation domain-containing protein|nr:amino acid adenylation domain-containing protein [Kofleriaceae bacterium]